MNGRAHTAIGCEAVGGLGFHPAATEETPGDKMSADTQAGEQKTQRCSKLKI